MLHGVSDAAGEIGHMTIDFTGRRCKCGNYGCLETYASGPNIAATIPPSKTILAAPACNSSGTISMAA